MGSIVGCLVFFFQAEDGIRDLVRSRGLGDVYKRQGRKPDARGHHGGRDHGRDARRNRQLIAAGSSQHALSLIHI